jgi:hypothetical protein
MFNSAASIVDYITPERLMAEIGVKPDALRKAKRAGKLPAMLYEASERLAGRPLPRSMIYFKGIST